MFKDYGENIASPKISGALLMELLRVVPSTREDKK